MLAQPGDTVKQGQPIIQLDPRVAESTLNEKKAARDELRSSLILLKASPRPEEQKIKQLAVENAKIGVRKAEAAVERLQPLLERKEIAPQQMFEAKLALEQARVAQQDAETQLTVLMLGPRREAVKEAEDRITGAEMAVATAQTQCDLLTIRSPIEGVLDKITCRLGQTVATGTPVGEIVDTRQLYALLWLPPRDARLVRIGQKARVEAAHVVKEPAAGNAAPAKPPPGRVECVGQVADPQTGNFPVRVLVDNAAHSLGVGQTVAVALTVREIQDALVVPADAVFDLEEGALLNVVRDGKSVVLHPQIGIRNKQWVEVQGTDLKAGEPVITQGGWSLPDGTVVKEKEKEKEGGDEDDKKPASAEKPSEKRS
jgi:RND family efflux transporter MFP subunit